MTDEAGGPWAVVLAEVATALALLGGEGWIAGGCLRDALLGALPRDVDLVVTCEPLALARALRRTQSVTIATLNRESVRIGVRGAGGEPPLQLDVSPLTGGSLAADLERRDFRVNALALPLAALAEFIALPLRRDDHAERIQALPSLMDPLGGLADLRERRIVPASGHALADDPGRVLRAARLVARFGFSPSRTFLDAARAVAPVLPSLARDRLRGELNALLALPRAADGIDMLEQAGVVPALFPSLGGEGDVRAHALASMRAAACLQDGGEAYPGMEPLSGLAPLLAWFVTPQPDGLPRIVALRWGLLLHAPLSHARSNRLDMDESDTVTMADGVSPAGSERRLAWKVALYGHAGRIADLAADHTLRRARFFFEQLGDAAVDAIAAAAACNAALAVAPVEKQRFSASVAEGLRAILGEYFTERKRLIPPRLLTGDDLISELGIAPGRKIGVVLAGVRHAQLDGKLRTREEALEWARTLL